MDPQFNYTENNAKGTIEMKEGDQRLAHLTFSRIDEYNIIVNHTVTEPEARGQGAGKRIIEYLVEWARKHDQKVLPLCPFAKSVIEKNENMHDILRK